MTWPFDPPRTPMEARVHTALPSPPGWAYEPKWDGFRALAWGGPEPRLDSRNQRPLLRYFPELAPALALLPAGAVVDGEVVVVRDGRTDFDALQQRIHPAESRIRLLAEQTPAELVAFDLLAVHGNDLRGAPFAERRERVAALVEGLEQPAGPRSWHLTVSTIDVEEGRRWFDAFEAAGCDGIVAKALTGAYEEGKRSMVKVKHRRDADVVVGGYRVHKHGDRVGSLLLGLYDDTGRLHFIGHCSGFGDADRVALLERLRPLEVPDGSAALGAGGSVRAPGEPSRWSGDKDLAWVPVRPELVCEVSYDQLTGDRFRHATRFARWRPDKDPRECTFEQLERPRGPTFADVVAT
ncbi:MAG TPA: ATP-dependent DNA ligase [Egibacteraceae bacterium]|nr:ATP-dependent DNA ligase [Egibacteraceae bacterium]